MLIVAKEGRKTRGRNTCAVWIQEVDKLIGDRAKVLEQGAVPFADCSLNLPPLLALIWDCPQVNFNVLLQSKLWCNLFALFDAAHSCWDREPMCRRCGNRTSGGREADILLLLFCYSGHVHCVADRVCEVLLIRLIGFAVVFLPSILQP